MKLYVKPQNRIIDLYEEGELLQGSWPQEEEIEVEEGYAKEALSNKRGIWEHRGIWK